MLKGWHAAWWYLKISRKWWKKGGHKSGEEARWWTEQQEIACATGKWRTDWELSSCVKMTEQYEQQSISPRNTTVKPEHVTLPKCTTIALCFSTESTGFGSLQYELFVAHKESFKNYLRILGTGVNKKILCWLTWYGDVSIHTFQLMINSGY